MEVRLFLSSGRDVTHLGVRVVLDNVITKAYFESRSAQDLVPLFEAFAFLIPIGFRDD